MPNLKFSVIIVAYKNKEILYDCVNSIYTHNDIGKCLEVIIVDNSPKEDNVSSIKDFFKDIVYVYNPENGFGKGNNIGADIANGRYFLFLNPDTVLIEPIFNFALNCFEADPRLALFGVKLLQFDLKPAMSFYWIDRRGLLFNQLIKIFNRMNIFIDRKMFISGANLFVERNVFFKCGKFDENIFMYCEEADIIKRVQMLGFKTAYFSSKRIIHREGKCTEDNEFALQERLKSNKYYCKKYNLNIRKCIKAELNYTRLKYLAFLITNDARASICKKNINIMKSFLKSC